MKKVWIEIVYVSKYTTIIELDIPEGADESEQYVAARDAVEAAIDAFSPDFAESAGWSLSESYRDNDFTLWGRIRQK